MMEIELANCECCGLKEDCTPDYIHKVKADFHGKWLCGLCAEAARDELGEEKRKKVSGLEEAVDAHMSFCRRFKANPAIRIAHGMIIMLKRSSGRFGRSAANTSKVADDSMD